MSLVMVHGTRRNVIRVGRIDLRADSDFLLPARRHSRSVTEKV